MALQRQCKDTRFSLPELYTLVISRDYIEIGHEYSML